MKIQSKALQAKKRRRHIFYVLIIVSIPMLSFAGLSYASYIDTFQISSIKVQGTKVLSAQTISSIVETSLLKPIAFFFSRSTPLTYPKSEIKKEIEHLGLRVKNVDISVANHALTVNIDERTPVAHWCHYNSCALLDDTGLVYAFGTSSDVQVTFDTNTSAPITLGSNIADKEAFAGVMKFISALSEFGFTPTHAELSSEGDITLDTTPHIVIAFGQDTDKTYQHLVALESDPTFKSKITSHALDYIDLRFGNKIYYKEHATSTATQ